MRRDEVEYSMQEGEIKKLLLEGAKKETVPESLCPKEMEKWLRQHAEEGQGSMEGAKDRAIEGDAQSEGDNEGQGSWGSRKKDAADRRKRRNLLVWRCGTVAAAACLAIVFFVTARNSGGGDTMEDAGIWESADDAAADDYADGAADDGDAELREGTTYAKLYQSFEKYWSEQEELYREDAVDAVMDDAAVEDAAADDGAAADDMAAESGGAMNGTVLDKGGDAEADMSGGALSGEGISPKEDGTEDYGKTNRQEEAVEEADIMKNDGRYLYRVVNRQEGPNYQVRVVDTKDGLKEASLVGDFENVQDIYVWDDKLVVLEPRWAANGDPGIQPMGAGAETDDAVTVTEPSYSYCKIHVFDISDRTAPKEYHTFTVKGSYLDSRISGGYLYFFASCETSRPEKKEDVRLYVPMMDGEPMPEENITLPKGDAAASYLVMASVDMSHPDKFADTRALVASADKLYVSPENIYLADTQYFSYNKEGKQSDSTMLYRFSYKDGKMRKGAAGKVKGTLRDDMAMNEYHGCLRLVTTVQSQNVEKIVDDITGEFLGYDSTNVGVTNSLYVLGQDLKVVGKIENLAKDEYVYSARFMGDSGYFVTFRETDPLFSVDLSNPREPKILGELKISGFSEYLHFYADNLLLGIGMEADEDTGATEGMKLSMFDISNPADVKEQSKMELKEYEYSEALYNYKAVLIDTKKNLFGFFAENYEDKRDYLLFTFADGKFSKVMEVDCSDYERYGWEIRGTYIGQRFFLFTDTGLVEEYSLADGRKVATLE